jgi:cellulose 1,4-beta-cellobiosidase
MKTSTTPLVQISIQRLAPILVVILGVLLPAAALAQTHVDNPFIGATVYANPDYAAKVQTSIAQTTDATLRSKMQTVAQVPTFVWLDRIAAIAGTADSAGLQAHLNNALAQRQGSTPIVAEFVVYDLPGRDCAALASNGEIPLTAAGLAQYKTSYIDEIARIMALPAYQGIRIVTVIEPDSLPNLVTNLNLQSCAMANSTGIYAQGVQYALNKLHAIPNVYTYLDIGHSGWLGWPNNASGAVSMFSTIVDGTTAKRASVDGFVANTANDLPVREPFMSATQQVGGQQLISANFYSFDPDIDEASFTADLYSRFTGAGWPASIGFLIDTSRNGWGGPNRPTAASTSTDLTTFVNQSKIDTRQHRGLWCNQNGAGLGERPQVAPPGFPASHLDAFVWVKPPGDSDGASALIPNDEGKGFDRMCDPTFNTQYGVLSNALPNAPLSGHWFHTQFVQLVTNAFPPIGGGPPPPTCAAAPAGPATFTAAAASATVINVAWSAVTPPANCSIRYNLHRSTTSNFTPTTNTLIAAGLTTTGFSDPGRTPSTTYFYALEVLDAFGAAPLARSQATTPAGPGGGPGGGTCHVGFTVTNSWSTGFQAGLSIQNTGTTPITNWVLSWTFANGQSVSQLWNGSATQTGNTVTVNSMSYNSTIAAGASYNDVGMTGSGPATVPASFSINGTVCN